MAATATPLRAATAEPAPCSPPLTITLELHGRRHDVAAVGPGFVKLRHHVSADPGEGVLRFDVGEDVRERRVLLAQGLRADQRRQPLELSPAPAAV